MTTIIDYFYDSNGNEDYKYEWKLTQVVHQKAMQILETFPHGKMNNNNGKKNEKEIGRGEEP